jgi:LacI family transcriptional regulator
MSLSNESNNDWSHQRKSWIEYSFCDLDKIQAFKVFQSNYWRPKAAFNAVQHLIDNGCKNSSCSRTINPQNSIDRYIGYKKALEKQQHSFDTKLVYSRENVTWIAEEHLKQIIGTLDVDGYLHNRFSCRCFWLILMKTKLKFQSK